MNKRSRKKPLRVRDHQNIAKKKGISKLVPTTFVATIFSTSEKIWKQQICKLFTDH